MHLLLSLALALATPPAGTGLPLASDSTPGATAEPSATALLEGQQVALGPPPAPVAGPPARDAPPQAPAASRDAPSPSRDRPPILGLSLDGGFPDGLALSMLVRPVRPLRLDAGVTYNLIGFGLRGGVTLAPFRAGIAPVLRGEYGHTFDGDATGFVGNFTSLTPAERILLRNVGYDYASVQLGLEIGSSDRFVFFARGGVAWFWTTVQNFQAAAQATNPNVSEAQDAEIRGTVPTATLGVLFYF